MADLVEIQKQILKTGRFQSLKKCLQDRGISVSNKKKEELLELTEKTHELGLELTDNGESISDVVNAKLVTKDGTIPNPFNLYSDWSTDFSDAPNFAWGDLCCYLINKKGYDQEYLKAYKSLEQYRLHWDEHVYNLQRNKNIQFQHHIIKFSVKLTQREKTTLGNKPMMVGLLSTKVELFSLHIALALAGKYGWRQDCLLCNFSIIVRQFDPSFNLQL